VSPEFRRFENQGLNPSNEHVARQFHLANAAIQGNARISSLSSIEIPDEF
jgi:hypothetical protein